VELEDDEAVEVGLRQALYVDAREAGLADAADRLATTSSKGRRALLAVAK